MKTFIESYIKQSIISNNACIFREPLIGFASANDTIFSDFKTIISDSHLLPFDLLPEAKTVMAFFLPFTKEIVKGNKNGEYASRQWAETYHFTNNFINQLLNNLSKELVNKNVKMSWLLPTYVFDKEKLIADWSHKHIAYACGLGTFGKNNLLITKSGCAGRLGTAVLDTFIPPTQRPDKIHSCFGESGCTYCAKICPAKALDGNEFNRHSCYKVCLKNDEIFLDLDCVEVCGKCSTGPCAVL